jgi:hypothetical protein
MIQLVGHPIGLQATGLWRPRLVAAGNETGKWKASLDMTTTMTSPSTVRVNGWTPQPTDFSTTPRPRPGTRAVGDYTAGIDQLRYWVGSALTALVAALVGIVGLVVAHGILHVPVMFGSATALTPVHVGVFGLASAGIALAAAALYDGLLHVAPSPRAYYSWLIALLTVLAVLLPFTTGAGLHSQIAFAAVNLGVGLVTLILVPIAAVNARR